MNALDQNTSRTPLYRRISTYLLPLIVFITGGYVLAPQDMPDLSSIWTAFTNNGDHYRIIQERQHVLAMILTAFGVIIGLHALWLSNSMLTWYTKGITHLTDIRLLRNPYASILMTVMATYYVVNQMPSAIAIMPDSFESASAFTAKWLEESNESHIKLTLLAYAFCSMLFAPDTFDEYQKKNTEVEYKIGIISRNVLLIIMAKLCQVPLYLTYILLAYLVVTAVAVYMWEFADKFIHMDSCKFFMRHGITGVCMTPFVWIFCSITVPTHSQPVTLNPVWGLGMLFFALLLVSARFYAIAGRSKTL